MGWVSLMVRASGRSCFRLLGFATIGSPVGLCWDVWFRSGLGLWAVLVKATVLRWASGLGFCAGLFG